MQTAPHSLARDVRSLGWRLLRRGQGLFQNHGQMVINASRGPVPEAGSSGAATVHQAEEVCRCEGQTERNVKDDKGTRTERHDTRLEHGRYAGGGIKHVKPFEISIANHSRRDGNIPFGRTRRLASTVVYPLMTLVGKSRSTTGQARSSAASGGGGSPST
ncbi:uncharacterized protein LY79DRAFT_569091 [Colletotrichum navitas]|uniref:Uncharacterized protein n=1 Tax=Colletotrichum navitas TaxID=681940 RepID=A0AAD8PNT3_9PEZI|nr:uncharacterized protein LY79DRAFT_569091 [Colletotrichum navitas]KAK1573198.1 hypothetical protein LY79DRAFT_569091 [Colletotrichum navitas]